ncbi:MAG: hypothetical protein ACFFE2_13440 [Candidatus Thorarchaeota archaeon]
MENPIFPTNTENMLPVTYLEGGTSQAAPVPTLFAIRFFCRNLETALGTLLEDPDLQKLLSEREDEKTEIHESLLRVMHSFQEFLMIDVRR